jgi:hypothetical protein
VWHRLSSLLFFSGLLSQIIRMVLSRLLYHIHLSACV